MRQRERSARTVWLGVFFLLLTACAGTRSPDLERLYGRTAGAADQPPVVLVHGILGARLRRASTGEEVWTGGFLDLMFGGYPELAFEIDPQTLEPRSPGLEPYAITDQAAGRDFYRRIIRTLEVAGGYTRGTPGEPAASGARHYYLFVYDWRQDNVESARRLDALIEQIRADHGDPGLEVDVIAHSMGGLVARYYVRYGTADVLDGNEFPVNGHGARRIRRAILLGTPNLGSVTALRAFLEGVPVGFGRIRTEVLATMPSVYQLLPHPLNTWIIKSDGVPLDRDLFDVDLWRRFQWSVFDPEVRQRIQSGFDDPAQADAHIRLLEQYFEKQLERARRFVWSLTVPLEAPDVRYIVFGGDCELTPARVLVEEIDGESMLRLWPGEVQVRIPGTDYDALMLEPGDGSVTKASLLARESLDPSVPRHRHSFFPLDFAFFLCSEHDRLTGNIHFQDNLLHALLSRDR